MSLKTRKAFTMLELTFVIVIIGILSAIAVPKFAATRDDAEIASARTAVASLRTAIATLRQKNILKGVYDDINGSAALAEIEYGLSSDWSLSGNTFTYTGYGGTCVFTVASNRLTKGDCSAKGFDDL